MVPLRALREAHALTTAELAARIAEFGVDVHPDSLINIELGRKGVSNALRAAWARALGIKPLDIRLADDLADLFLATTPEEAGAEATP
jgi:transcriptional regulator with XRE-family HTH domain